MSTDQYPCIRNLEFLLTQGAPNSDSFLGLTSLPVETLQAVENELAHCPFQDVLAFVYSDAGDDPPVLHPNLPLTIEHYYTIFEPGRQG